jgi:hypothetical protein
VLPLLAAALIFSDIVIKFNAGVVVQHSLRALYVMHGGAIARLYVRHGSFWVDSLSLLPILVEVRRITLARAMQLQPW